MKLTVSHLCCVRQQDTLFEQLSFELQAGEALMIEGPNGSGKSSLLRLIAGIATPTAGHIRWDDTLIQHDRETFAEAMHYIGHQNGIKWGLTVLENLALAAHLNGTVLRDDTLELAELTLAQLGLDKHQHTLAKQLSAGQRRRLALAKLFIFPKTLWLLDEPYTALDVDSQSLLNIKLESHLESGGMAIISTHHKMLLKRGHQQTLRLGEC